MSVLAKSFSAVLLALPFSLAAFSDPLPPDLTYRPLPTLPFSRVKAADEAKPKRPLSCSGNRVC